MVLDSIFCVGELALWGTVTFGALVVFAMDPQMSAALFLLPLPRLICGYVAYLTSVI